MTSAGGAGAGLINRTSRTSPTAAPRGPTAPRSTQSTTYRAPARGSRIKCMPTQAEGRGAEGDRGGAVYARAPRRPLRAREGLSIDPHQWDPLWCSLSVCRGASRCTLYRCVACSCRYLTWRTLLGTYTKHLPRLVAISACQDHRLVILPLIVLLDPVGTIIPRSRHIIRALRGAGRLMGAHRTTGYRGCSCELVIKISVRSGHR